MSRFLRPLPASGKVLKRYAVWVDGRQVGEVMRVRMRGRRNMIGTVAPWVVKVKGARRPIWEQWLNSEREAAEFLVSTIEARTQQRERERARNER